MKKSKKIKEGCVRSPRTIFEAFITNKVLPIHQANAITHPSEGTGRQKLAPAVSKAGNHA